MTTEPACWKAYDPNRDTSLGPERYERKQKRLERILWSLPAVVKKPDW